MNKLKLLLAGAAVVALTGATFLQGSQTPGVLAGGGTGAIPILQSDGSVQTIIPKSATTLPANPSAVTPGTSTAQMLGLAAGTNPSVITPAFSGRVFYEITMSVVVGSTTNGATFQCAHGVTSAAPANAAALPGSWALDANAYAYLAGATTEKAIVRCSGIVTGLTIGTSEGFDVAVLNTTGSQAVTATVVGFNALEF